MSACRLQTTLQPHGGSCNWDQLIGDSTHVANLDLILGLSLRSFQDFFLEPPVRSLNRKDVAHVLALSP